MKQKPTPNRELVTIKYGQHIRLIPYSEDARILIENEAKNYGYILKMLADNPISYSLQVSEGYDIDEVVAYFESYNEDN